MNQVQTIFQFECEHAWIEVRDGDVSVRSVFDRHYSRRKFRDDRYSSLFVGPGEKMVLRTAAGDAICVWRKFMSMNNQNGINCAIYRNESDALSSHLLLQAMKLAWKKWPGERLYTYVNPKRIRSTNPGFCFLEAGWTRCGETKSGLKILERHQST